MTTPRETDTASVPAPLVRPRRLRSTPAMRRLVAETTLAPR
ncbi:porphobilinogen synthase, partial [Dietzia natronolimnaea]|nr:porphobilinogen synthase [Dietzia natronolimnaea]